jgi:spermidine synthase
VRYRIFKSASIVFIASFATMVIEISAGRMLSPHVGVSLYTWTSIIGVVLAGVGVGAWAGGVVADRSPRFSTLGWVFFVSGLTILPIPLLVRLLGGAHFSGDLMARTLMMTTLIFFVPSLLLGMVCPVSVRIALKDVRQAGTVAGKIYSISAAGSIVGTFLAGFLLISLLGTRDLFAMMAALLLLLGTLLVARRGRTRLIGCCVLLLLLWPFYHFVLRAGRDDLLLFKETNYYTIRLMKSTGENNLVTLYLDQLTHSCSDLDDPTNLVYRYTRSYAEILGWRIDKTQTFKTLSIGGGGYTFPRYLEAIYPKAAIDVVEIDPAITRLSREYMGISPSTRIRTFNEDARWFAMTHRDAGPYDFIFEDAFNDLSIPYHITTRESLLDVKRILSPRGLFIANVIDRFEAGSFLPAFIRTLEDVFGVGMVHMITLGSLDMDGGVENRLVVANLSEKEARDLAASLNGRAPERRISYVVPFSELQERLTRFHPQILTDNYVPVDNLTADNFR